MYILCREDENINNPTVQGSEFIVQIIVLDDIKSYDWIFNKFAMTSTGINTHRKRQFNSNCELQTLKLEP